MKRILLDYDNTICDFNRMLVEKWKKLPGAYKKFKFHYNDITNYSLVYCLTQIGYSDDEALILLNNFWNVKNLYQEYYTEAHHRNKVLKILKQLKESDDTYIELNTICNTFVMVDSKLKKLEEDTELTNLIDNIVINKCNLYNKFKKSTDYDIVIDDNPNYILHYLENNITGMVFMPTWKYNEHLLPHQRIVGIK